MWTAAVTLRFSPIPVEGFGTERIGNGKRLGDCWASLDELLMDTEVGQVGFGKEDISSQLIPTNIDRRLLDGDSGRGSGGLRAVSSA